MHRSKGKETDPSSIQYWVQTTQQRVSFNLSVKNRLNNEIIYGIPTWQEIKKAVYYQSFIEPEFIENINLYWHLDDEMTIYLTESRITWETGV